MATPTPDQTLNPNAADQCPPPPHPDPQTLTISDPPPSLADPPPLSPNPSQPQDQEIFHPDLIPGLADDHPEPDSPASPAAVVGGGAAKRAPKRKRPFHRRSAQERRFREKLQVITETLKPVPFAPAKNLDFEKHKSLLQRLGLWDFVHIEFDSALRGDLLAQLIASYVPSSRCSYVNGVRINVNRADLGRALKLPRKSPAGASSSAATAAETAEPFDLAEAAGFFEEFVETWMLLHPDDAYVVSDDVPGCLSLIKEGNFEKVDWAGLIWSMVDKELKAPQLVNCYYAPHLQHLIKVQHEELLEAAVEEVNVVKDEEEEEEEEEVDGSGDVKMGDADESEVRELEEHNIELSLGQDNVVERVEEEKEQGGEEQMMDVAFEPAKEEEHGMWLLNQKNCVAESFLRPCHGGNVKSGECEQPKEDDGEDGHEQEEEEEEEEEEDGEEDEHEGGFNLSAKCIPFEGMSSGNGSLMMEAAQMPFGSGIDLRDNPVGDFLSARDDPQMISGSSLFGNGHKRDNMGLDNHMSHHSLNGSNKRMRSDSPWNSKPMDFESCMEQMEHLMGKARMIYATKDQACEESTVNQQLLISELQKRDTLIDHLHKAKLEEVQKRQMEVYRFEKELYMMQSLVEGYRKALKETRKAFAEYRAHCPQGDEPLYKDVPGSGGLVMTVMELEKERLKKEAEERAKLRDFMRDFENKCTDLESIWFGKLEGHMSSVESLSNKLLCVEDRVKELNAQWKVSEPIECAPTTEEETA